MAEAGDDGELRFSSPVQRNRPIWALLLAYHAFANVSIFLSRAPGLSDEARKERLSKNLPHAVQLQRTIESLELRYPAMMQLYGEVRSQFERNGAASEIQAVP